MKTFLLQSMSLPRAETTEPLLYARTHGEVQFSESSAILHVGSELSFDTSFGVFAAGRWRRLTTVRSFLKKLSCHRALHQAATHW
jgi:hypothetical protein